MDSPIRVLIADDNPVFRAQLHDALDGRDGFEVCADAGDAPAAVQLATELVPDVCLVDVCMPGYGVAAAWEITARLPSCSVVMVTVSDDESHLFAALRAGACGYLLKDQPPDAIRQALLRVLDGEAAIDGRLVARMAETFRDPAPRRRQVLQRVHGASLTSREWEVLELLKQALETAEIADRLSLSKGTVRTHVAGILHKLRAPDREAAIRMFEDDGDAAELVGASHGR